MLNVDAVQIEVDETVSEGRPYHRARWKCPKCGRRVELLEVTFLGLARRIQDERADRRCAECRTPKAKQVPLWK
jgi:endogenous inhibitor of DNA gyrase (YacG/DUF329 family)